MKVILFLEPSHKTESLGSFSAAICPLQVLSFVEKKKWDDLSLTRQNINRWMHMEMVQHLNQTSGVPLLATFRVEICMETTQTAMMEVVAMPIGAKQTNQLTSTVNRWTPRYVSTKTSFL